MDSRAYRLPGNSMNASRLPVVVAPGAERYARRLGTRAWRRMPRLLLATLFMAGPFCRLPLVPGPAWALDASAGSAPKFAREAFPPMGRLYFIDPAWRQGHSRPAGAAKMEGWVARRDMKPLLLSGPPMAFAVETPPAPARQRAANPWWDGRRLPESNTAMRFLENDAPLDGMFLPLGMADDKPSRGAPLEIVGVMENPAWRFARGEDDATFILTLTGEGALGERKTLPLPPEDAAEARVKLRLALSTSPAKAFRGELADGCGILADSPLFAHHNKLFELAASEEDGLRWSAGNNGFWERTKVESIQNLIRYFHHEDTAQSRKEYYALLADLAEARQRLRDVSGETANAGSKNNDTLATAKIEYAQERLRYFKHEGDEQSNREYGELLMDLADAREGFQENVDSASTDRHAVKDHKAESVRSELRHFNHSDSEFSRRRYDELLYERINGGDIAQHPSRSASVPPKGSTERFFGSKTRFILVRDAGRALATYPLVLKVRYRYTVRTGPEKLRTEREKDFILVLKLDIPTGILQPQRPHW